MPITDPNLAGDANLGSYTPVELFAGDGEVITEPAVILTGQGLIAKWTVVARNAAGKWVKHDPAAVDGTQNAAGITTAPVDTTSADVNVPVYTGGFFNNAALVWAAATNTLALRKAAFARTPIRIGEVRL